MSFQSSFDTFIADLKTIAAGAPNPRAKLHELYGKAASKLGARQTKLVEFDNADANTFLNAKQAEFETHKAAQAAQRALEGVTEE